MSDLKEMHPPSILPSVAAAKIAAKQLLSTKSTNVYKASYQRLLKYCERGSIKKYSKNALLKCFNELNDIQKMKSFFMWSYYSKIRSLLYSYI